MADITNLIESKNLNGEELGSNLHPATIKGVTIEEFNNEQKVVVEFVELDKRLICNLTQTKTLANLFGANTDTWIGQKVNLLGEQLSSGKFAGRWTVRILPTQAQQQPQQQAFEV